MQSLTGAYLETIPDKLLVFCVDGTLPDFHPPIAFIGKKRMPDRGHVYPYLMGSTRFEPAFHQSHIAESLEDFVMSNRPFPLLRIVENPESEPVVRIPSYVGIYRPFVLLDISPNHCVIASFDAVFEELAGQL